VSRLPQPCNGATDVKFLNKHCPGLTQDIRDCEGKLHGNALTSAEFLAIEHGYHAVAKLLGEHLDSLESNTDLQKDSNSSTSRLDMHHRKPWQLPPCPKSTHVKDYDGKCVDLCCA
jgi:hypothetical protein